MDTNSPSQPKRLAWLHDPTGNVSSMRIGFMVGIILSAICVVAGISLSVYETVIQASLHTSNGLGLTGLGVGIFTTGSLAKSWQSQSENIGIQNIGIQNTQGRV